MEKKALHLTKAQENKLPSQKKPKIKTRLHKSCLWHIWSSSSYTASFVVNAINEHYEGVTVFIVNYM